MSCDDFPRLRSLKPRQLFLGLTPQAFRYRPSGTINCTTSKLALRVSILRSCVLSGAVQLGGQKKSIPRYIESRMSGIDNILQNDGIGIALTGMSIVFVALMLITLFIAILPKVLNALSGILPAEAEQHATAAPTVLQPAASQDETEVVAAIGFALHRMKTKKQGRKN